MLDPHLSLLVRENEKRLLSFVKADLTESWDNDLGVVPSCLQLVDLSSTFFQNMLGLSANKPLADITQAIVRCFGQYVDHLREQGKWVADRKKITVEDKIASQCFVINTSIYVSSVVDQLEDKFHRFIHPFYKLDVSFVEIRNRCQDLIGNTKELLNVIVGRQTSKALGLSSHCWTKDRTKNIKIFCEFSRQALLAMDKLMADNRVFREIFVYHVDAVIDGYYKFVGRAGCLSMVETERVYSELNTIKRHFCNMVPDCLLFAEAIHMAHASVVDRFQDGEGFVAMLMTPVDPPQAFMEKYQRLFPDKQQSVLLKILDLKKRDLKHEVLLSPSFFGPGLMSEVERRLRTQIEGSCQGDVGFIVCILSVDATGDGMVQDNRGVAAFDVGYKALVFRPQENQVIDAVVDSVTKMGFFAYAGPLQIFVSSHLIPEEFEFDSGSNPPCYVSGDMAFRIVKSSLVRLRIVGIRADVGEIFAVGTMKEDYLGVIED